MRRCHRPGEGQGNDIEVELVWDTPGDTDQTDDSGADVDLAGSYVVELVVIDEQGNRPCTKPAQIQITATPREDVYLELVWDTDPTDQMGADLDLHYLNPKATSWNQSPYDIWSLNQTADWGQESVKSDDPSLKREDGDGTGPEGRRPSFNI